ncbi:MAG: hypothetical protein ABI658_16165 [Acidimicrobiales bacterium]
MNDDDRALARYADELVRVVESSMGDWVEARVRSVLDAQHRSIDAQTATLIDAARLEATRDVSAELRAVLALDIDEQRRNPLSILRAAVRYPTRVLRAVGAQMVERDEFDERSFPDDEFSLTPAAFADFGPEVHDAGIVWGAAKAHVHLQRRRVDKAVSDNQ